MGLESGTYVSDLVVTNPTGSDDKRQGDDHLRLVKSVLRNTFPNATKPFYFRTQLSKTSNYTILGTDDGAVISADATGLGFTLTLPTLAGSDVGWRVVIVKSDATTNLVTIGGTVDGIVNPAIRYQLAYREVTWDGARFTFLNGAGEWCKIGDAVAVAASTIDFVGLSSKFDEYEIRGTLTFSAEDSLALRFGTGGGPTYDSGANYNYGVVTDNNFDNTKFQNVAQTFIILGTGATDGPGSIRFNAKMGYLSGANTIDVITDFGGIEVASSNFFMGQSFGTHTQAIARTAARLIPQSGLTTMSGRVGMWGRRG